MQKLHATDNLNSRRETRRNSPKVHISYVHVTILQTSCRSLEIPLLYLGGSAKEIREQVQETLGENPPHFRVGKPPSCVIQTSTEHAKRQLWPHESAHESAHKSAHECAHESAHEGAHECAREHLVISASRTPQRKAPRNVPFSPTEPDSRESFQGSRSDSSEPLFANRTLGH